MPYICTRHKATGTHFDVLYDTRQHILVSEAMEDVLVFGAGGHAKVVIDILLLQGEVRIRNVVDSAPGEPLLGIPKIDEGEAFALGVTRGVVAIGDNRIRAEVVTKIKKARSDFRFINAIHPSAVCSPSAAVGPGTVVMAHATLNPACSVGEHVIVNTNASVDHDCELQNFSSVAPGATLGGAVHIGWGSAVGLGANVNHGIVVGAETVIGSGAVVVDDIPPRVVALGNPCRVIRERVPSEPYL